jgi:hypothetical protein
MHVMFACAERDAYRVLLPLHRRFLQPPSIRVRGLDRTMMMMNDDATCQSAKLVNA